MSKVYTVCIGHVRPNNNGRVREPFMLGPVYLRDFGVINAERDILNVPVEKTGRMKLNLPFHAGHGAHYHALFRLPPSCMSMELSGYVREWVRIQLALRGPELTRVRVRIWKGRVRMNDYAMAEHPELPWLITGKKASPKAAGQPVVDFFCHAKNRNAQTPMNWAARHGAPEMAQMLLATGAEVDVVA